LSVEVTPPAPYSGPDVVATFTIND